MTTDPHLLDRGAGIGQSWRVPAGPRERCPNLFQVLGAYLHQDFDLEYPTAEDALAAAVAGQGWAHVRAAASELRSHRPPQHDEAASAQFVNELCSYHPPSVGLSYTRWLDHVQHVLDAARPRS